MHLLPNLSPYWYAVPLLPLFTIQLVWLICCYAPATYKDYALPDRRRAWLVLVTAPVAYLLVVLSLLAHLGLLPSWESDGLSVLLLAMIFWGAYPRPESPAYREKGRLAFHLLSAVTTAFGLLCWLA